MKMNMKKAARSFAIVAVVALATLGVQRASAIKLEQAWGCKYTEGDNDVCDYVFGNTNYHITCCLKTDPNYSNCGFTPATP